MNYWQAVLLEVLNKDDPDYPCYFTNLKKPESVFSNQCATSALESSKQGEYIAEHGDEEVPITPREAQSLELMLKGCTIRETAEVLGLSYRTVEFYLKNLRTKFAMDSKQQLLDKLRNWTVRRRV